MPVFFYLAYLLVGRAGKNRKRAKIKTKQNTIYNISRQAVRIFENARQLFLLGGIGMNSIKAKLILVIVGVACFTTLCVGGLFVENMVQGSREAVTLYREDLTASVERELKLETETALSVIQTVYEQQQAGKLTPEQARQEAAARVRALRYNDGKGYFWIDTYEGVNVVLLGRNTEGQSRINAVDPAGRHFIQEMIANGRKAGGG